MTLAASEVVRFELLAGVRDDEREALEEFFRIPLWVPVSSEVTRLAGRLARRFARSHEGIDAPDYMIAATVLLLDTELLTTNVRHFPMLEDLRPAYEQAPCEQPPCGQAPAPAEQLRARGHDVVAVVERHGLPGTADRELFELAQDEHRAIVTENVPDFMRLGQHHGLVLAPKSHGPSHRLVGWFVRALDRLLADHPGTEATSPITWLR